jgi:hypothetical protein
MRSTRRCEVSDGGWRRTSGRERVAHARRGRIAAAALLVRPLVLDEGRGVARVLLLLLDRLLFLWRVLRLLLAGLRGLMGHGSLLWIALTMAPRHYRPKLRIAQVRAGVWARPEVFARAAGPDQVQRETRVTAASFSSMSGFRIAVVNAFVFVGFARFVRFAGFIRFAGFVFP